MLALLAIAAPPVPVPSPAPQFSSPVSVTVRLEDPQGLQVVDIDGDGALDIVAGTGEAGEVFAWRGSPSGFPPRPELVLDLEPGLEGLELIDLDLDGDVDLLAEYPGPRLVAHLNDGAGAFGAEVLLFQGPGVSTGTVLRFDVADVAGDPRPEIVFSLEGAPAGSDQSVFVLSDLLSGAPVQSLIFDATSPVIGVFAEDVDADGDADIFLCTLDSAEWYRNDGAFTLLGSSVILPPNLGLDANFASGDVDGDGFVDIVTHAIGIFGARTNAHLGDGTGQFAAPINLNYNDRSGLEVQLSDLDADGDDDVVLCGEFSTGLITIESFSAGSFGARTGAPGRTSRVLSMDAADLDGDGRPEVVHVTEIGAVRVQGAEVGAPTLELTTEISAVTQTVEDVVESLVADLNGDGNLDILALQPQPGRLRWWPGDGTGGFGDWAAPVEVGPNPCGVNSIDVDADGDIDLLFSIEWGAAMGLVENLGGGVFSPLTRIPLPAAGRCDLDTSDFDGDGLPDVLRLRSPDPSFYWSRNLGNGAFAPEELLLTPPSSWQTYTVADMEGDGDLDVLVDATENATGLTILDWYTNDGAANFTGPFRALAAANGFGFGFSQGIVHGDYNGDGHGDVVQSLGRKGPPGGSQLSLMTGTGTGTFHPPQLIAQSPLWSLWSPSFGDIDADGFADLLVNSSSLDWYRGRGDGTFEPPVTFVETLAFFTQSHFMSVDLDRDGDLDHAVATGSYDTIVAVETLALGNLGTSFCDPSVPNSTGRPAALRATGSAQLASNAVTLEATDLPPQILTLFVVSRTIGPPLPVLNSQGNLCLTGPIGRFTGTGQVQMSSASGGSSLTIDASNLPEPNGTAAALVGESWAFQAWYRDMALGVPASNLTSGALVRFL